MDTDRWLAEHPFDLDAAGLDAARALLAALTRDERGRQGAGDTELMRLLCAQLFAAGDPRDALAVAAARASSFDARAAIEAELLCGAGVEATERWLGARGEEAAEALSQLREAVARGDLEGFSAEEARAAHRRYYLDDAP